jgi:hypothetical protein
LCAPKDDTLEPPFLPKFVVGHSDQSIQRITDDDLGIGDFENSNIVVNHESELDDRQGKPGVF